MKYHRPSSVAKCFGLQPPSVTHPESVMGAINHLMSRNGIQSKPMTGFPHSPSGSATCREDIGIAIYSQIQGHAASDRALAVIEGQRG